MHKKLIVLLVLLNFISCKEDKTTNIKKCVDDADEQASVTNEKLNEKKYDNNSNRKDFHNNIQFNEIKSGNVETQYSIYYILFLFLFIITMILSITLLFLDIIKYNFFKGSIKDRKKSGIEDKINELGKIADDK